MFLTLKVLDTDAWTGDDGSIVGDDGTRVNALAATMAARADAAVSETRRKKGACAFSLLSMCILYLVDWGTAHGGQDLPVLTPRGGNADDNSQVTVLTM